MASRYTNDSHEPTVARCPLFDRGSARVPSVAINAKRARIERKPIRARTFPSDFGMDTGRCLKRRTDRAYSPIIRAIHSRWTERFEDFFKCSTQLALRLDLIRGLTP